MINPSQTTQVFEKVAGFLKSLGVRVVLDTAAAREMSRMEAAADFVQRFRAATPSAPPSAPSPAMASVSTSSSEPAPPLPVLASSCPGWVCYAEKTHGTYVLPYVSTAKSPQAIMGTLIKRHLSTRWREQYRYSYYY
jgi:iron only hydrogenase large subunit-like protein